MKLIVGLGNPGKQYERTPHNAGFIAMESIKRECERLGYQCSGWSTKKKEQSEIAEVFAPSGNRIAVFAKPLTYMNISGRAVLELVRSYGIKDLTEVLVVYDELDIPLGEYKYSPVKNSRTHKGIESIVSSVGKEFHSLRIGVDNRTNRRIIGSDYVLKRYTEDELVTLHTAIQRAITMHVISFLGLV